MSQATSPSEAITTAPAARPVIPSADSPAPAVQRTKAPKPLWKRALEPIASLRLTVILFALSLFLVFAGTLAQAETGNLTIINQYFRSYGFVWIPWQVLVKFGQVFLGISPEAHVAGAFPFPGGWLLGVLLMTNLLAAHAVRFRFTWIDLLLLPLFAAGLVLMILSEIDLSAPLLYYAGLIAMGAALSALIPVHLKRSGVILIHLGLIVMMASEWVTGNFAVEGSMVLAEGETTNFVDDNHAFELAITHRADPKGKTDDVVVIPASLLRKGQPIRHALLPFDIVVEKYMNNSHLERVRPGVQARATAGEGKGWTAVEKPEVSGTDMDQGIDFASAYLTLKNKNTEESLGTYLVSLWFYSNYSRRQFPDVPQTVRVDGKEYEIMLRSKRSYRDFSVRLLEFRHDRFQGVNTPKNFSSLVRLVDPRPDQREDREVKIWMNHPLRHAGETFYQNAVLSGDSGTVLQVVRNPGWRMPYLACLMVALGMLIHFGFHLVGFLRRRVAL
jgi:ResB-like family